MVFRFATFDPAQDPDDFNPAFLPTPSSSPSVTLCQPCEYSYTFTKTIVRRLVAAGASLVLTAPASEFHDEEIRDPHAETPLHGMNFDARPEFHQGQLKEFTLEELKVVTQNFSNEKLIGRGGFGAVYEGRLADGSQVAIKRMGEDGYQGTSEFEREIMAGGIITPHHNLLPLLGFCRTPQYRDLLLVSPLMINKSLECFLTKRPERRPPLDWLTRRKIALGAARGLCCLHDLNIVHLDIKPSNIMLDEEFEPRIGDFGLVKFTNGRRRYSVNGIEKAPVLPRNESEAGSHSEDIYFTTRVRGTNGYLAPEYGMQGIFSVKTDVFAFGITLLQLVTGQKATKTKDRHVMLGDWVKELVVEGSWEIIVDPNLQDERDHAEIEKVIQLALLCTQSLPRRRPFMAQVVQILEGHGIEERWEKYCCLDEYPIQSNELEYCHSDEYTIQSNLLPTPCWGDDISSSLMSPEELSGPR